ncbi:MAG: tetratricopeptide repeat protein [Spirochaetes bacterium]|nr:tetratricopeptide repeat protein [Spirochaetota bacterium]
MISSSKKCFLAILFTLCVSVVFAPVNAPLHAQNTQDILSEIADRFANRDFRAAIELFDGLDSAQAQLPEILIMRAVVLNAAGMTAQARTVANGIVAGQPNNIDAIMIIADSFALEGNDRERRLALERVLRIEPNNPRALVDLGKIALNASNLNLAARHFDQALAADPYNGEALVARAIVHRYSNQPADAERLLNRAVQRYPQWASPLQERARLYRSGGFVQDAVQDLRIAQRLEPHNQWVAVDLGMALISMNRRQEALTEFNRAVSLDPENFLALVHSAGLREEFGDFDGAIRDLQTLTRIRPDYFFGFESLGLIMMKQQRWAEARDAFMEAHRRAPPEFSFSYAMLASINLMRAGRPTDARPFLAQAMRNFPNGSMQHSMLRLFHNLNGDLDVARMVEREENLNLRASLLFFLASYYDITGSTLLANRHHLMVRDLNRSGIIEWRLNEFILEQRGFARPALGSPALDEDRG